MQIDLGGVDLSGVDTPSKTLPTGALIAVAPVTVQAAAVAEAASAPSTPLQNTITLSGSPGTNIERFTAQAKGKVSITITHAYSSKLPCNQQYSTWVLAGTTINDITLDNQETLKTPETVTVTLPVPGQYSITGTACYPWTATVSNA